MKNELTQTIKALKNYIKMEEEALLFEIPMRSAFLEEKTIDKRAALAKIAKEISACRGCELYQTRRNTVPGEGSENARLMFIGEAPGMEEDIQARPFVGRAGQLLTKIIEAMGMRRQDVYIANSLKCRPPKNRTPLPAEIAACRNYLTSQIDIIKPTVICCLGRPASQALLVTDMPIGKLRGKFYDYNGIKVMPTFHPAYLLRNPADKKIVWEDMKKIKSALR